MAANEPVRRRSLPSGIAADRAMADARCMSTALLTKLAPAASKRILADASALVSAGAPREPALERLEQAIGRDFADRLVAALSDKSGHRH